MKLTTSSTITTLWAVLALSAIASSNAAEQIVSVHGSGTTNPSKCYWSVMERLQAAAKRTVRLTYRSIGTGSGQDEFLNAADAFAAVTDFGSGDIPLPEADYALLKDAEIEIIHLPVLLGAVTFFYNIEDVNGANVADLNMTPCVLAQIFAGQILEWDNEAVTDLNPNMNLPPSGNDILIARRKDGSSSSSSITEYFNTVCPDDWTAEATGSKPTWPVARDAMECVGSGGMTDCIRNSIGAIGYVDAGFGLSAGLVEVRLQNKDETFLTSETASNKGGISAAVGEGVLPEIPSDDFSAVSLVNKPGENTWPIVQMTFIYVRKSLLYKTDPDEQGLLVAFLKALYDSEYSGKCYDDFGFTALSESQRQYALSAIETLIVSTEATVWTFETDTDLIDGAGEYVISGKRNNYLAVQEDDLEVQTLAMQRDIEILKNDLFDATEIIFKLEASASTSTETDDMQLKAALAMSSISFVFVMVALLVHAVGLCRGKSASASTEKADASVV